MKAVMALLLMCSGLHLGAQQLPVTTLPLDHPFDAHPAAAADSAIRVSIWQRSPWTGLPSAPRTTALALTSPTGSESFPGVPDSGVMWRARPGWQASTQDWPTRPVGRRTFG